MAAGPVILHDNAAPHLSERMTSLLARYKWEPLPRPPYSPDVSPCDFDIFPRSKENVRGVKFEDFKELEDAMAGQVRLYERGCRTTGIQKLPSRWRLVIGHKRHY